MVTGQTSETKTDLITKWVAITLDNKHHRSILEVCKLPSTVRQVRVSLQKRMFRQNLHHKLNVFAVVGLVERMELRYPGRKRILVKYKLTPMGERLLKVKPGARPLMQYIIGGFDR